MYQSAFIITKNLAKFSGNISIFETAFFEDTFNSLGNQNIEQRRDLELKLKQLCLLKSEYNISSKKFSFNFILENLANFNSWGFVFKNVLISQNEDVAFKFLNERDTSFVYFLNDDDSSLYKLDFFTYSSNNEIKKDIFIKCFHGDFKNYSNILFSHGIINISFSKSSYNQETKCGIYGFVQLLRNPKKEINKTYYRMEQDAIKTLCASLQLPFSYKKIQTNEPIPRDLIILSTEASYPVPIKEDDKLDQKVINVFHNSLDFDYYFNNFFKKGNILLKSYDINGLIFREGERTLDYYYIYNGIKTKVCCYEDTKEKKRIPSYSQFYRAINMMGKTFTDIILKTSEDMLLLNNIPAKNIFNIDVVLTGLDRSYFSCKKTFLKRPL